MNSSGQAQGCDIRISSRSNAIVYRLYNVGKNRLLKHVGPFTHVSFVIENRLQKIYFADASDGKVHIRNARTHKAMKISNKRLQGNGERAVWTNFDGSSRQTFTVR